MNDGIDHTSVDDVVLIVSRLRKGTLMAKIDIEAAYRLLPVHPQDRLLQAVQWNGMVFVDPMLPFGPSLAPKIFNAGADALEWILQQEGVVICQHCLVNFFVAGPPDSQACQRALETLDRVCGQLGVPMAAHKREGPTKCLTF